MKEISISTPINKEQIKSLKAGDSVLLSGTIYTARDAAHARICNAINNNEKLPIKIEGQIIYYAGPSPTPLGKPVGSIGPTTSSRMDSFTPQLLKLGLLGTIGKGSRSDKVVDAMVENSALYFVAIGGCAALGANCVLSCDVVAYEDLGTESIKKLVVKDLPLIVAVDSYGNDYFKDGQKKYLEGIK